MTNFESSDRGLKYYEPIETRHGVKVRVYESSVADEACVWMSMMGDTAVLLTLDQIDELVISLLTAKANHYQRQTKQ